MLFMHVYMCVCACVYVASVFLYHGDLFCYVLHIAVAAVCVVVVVVDVIVLAVVCVAAVVGITGICY